MRQISAIGKQMLAMQEELAARNNYAPIEPNLFDGDVRQRYLEALPSWCALDGDPEASLYTLDDTLVSKGYTRIVIGDYGAYVEISPEQICEDALRYKPGQEYREKLPQFAKNVKYAWLTAKDNSDCKIYRQKRTVAYADYVPGMYYISVYEVDVTI